MLGFLKKNSRAVVLGGAALAVAAAAPAAALTVADFAKNADRLDGVDSSAYRFIQLSPTAAHMEGGAHFDDGAYGFGGLIMPGEGPRSSIAYGITLPPDYKPGTKLQVRILWHTDSVNCKIDLRPNATAVSRPGVQHQTVGNASAGLTGGPLTAPATAKVTGSAAFYLTPPKSTVSPLKPFDGYQFGLFRSVESATDTCAGDLHIDAIAVRY